VRIDFCPCLIVPSWLMLHKCMNTALDI
jgi:hypothetical protein